MIRVVVVDDHQLFAEGLATALSALPDIEVAATFDDGSEFMSSPIAFDVLILDLEMPTVSGLDVLASVKRGTRTIVVSMHTGEQERLAALDLGARAFLSKATPLVDLAAAIRAVSDERDLADSDPTLVTYLIFIGIRYSTQVLSR